jgi:hypothetical protein
MSTFGHAQRNFGRAPKVYNPHSRDSPGRIRRYENVPVMKIPVRHTPYVHLVDDVKESGLDATHIWEWKFLHIIFQRHRLSSADPAHYHDGQFVSNIIHIQYRLYTVFMSRFEFDSKMIILIKSRDNVGSLEAQEGFPLVGCVIRYNLHEPTVIQFKDATVHAPAYIFMNFWPVWLQFRH